MLDKNKISETELMQGIISNFTVNDIYSKIHFNKNHEIFYNFYVTFQLKSDIITAYGTQGEVSHLNAFGKDVYNRDYINLYYYKDGKNVAGNIKKKQKNGYVIDRNIIITELHDRTSDKIWKMNFLLHTIFNKNETMSEDFIKYINDISVMKFLFCSQDKPLLKKHMIYMNELYRNIK